MDDIEIGITRCLGDAIPPFFFLIPIIGTFYSNDIAHPERLRREYCRQASEPLVPFGVSDGIETDLEGLALTDTARSLVFVQMLHLEEDGLYNEPDVICFCNHCVLFRWHPVVPMFVRSTEFDGSPHRISFLKFRSCS